MFTPQSQRWVSGACGRFTASARARNRLELVGHWGERSAISGGVFCRQSSCFRPDLERLHTFVRIPVAALLAYGATAIVPSETNARHRCQAEESRSQLMGVKQLSELR